MIDLSNITLVGVDGTYNTRSIDNLKSAISISTKHINFGDIKFIGTGEPSDNDDFDCIQISPMSWGDYVDFMLFELVNYVDTEFVINIQEDGFILNPYLWLDEFLEYDYIGAPFSYELHFGPNSPQYLGESIKWVHDSVRKKAKEDINLVGNSGFSLRSKKLLKETAKKPFENYGGPDDVYICANYYDYFVSRGIKFAPVELASKFSLQLDMQPNPNEASKSIFGFHGDKKMLESFL
jgi:hypothetical protein